MSLSYKQQILLLLNPHAGWTTGDIAALCSPDSGNRHTHSAHIRKQLLELQREGKVKPMDDQKPVCWVLTEESP